MITQHKINMVHKNSPKSRWRMAGRESEGVDEDGEGILRTNGVNAID